jgi:hypothetical protein
MDQEFPDFVSEKLPLSLICYIVYLRSADDGKCQVFEFSPKVDVYIEE